jgi:hypothetical protein
VLLRFVFKSAGCVILKPSFEGEIPQFLEPRGPGFYRTKLPPETSYVSLKQTIKTKHCVCRLGMLAHACNPSYLGSRDRKIQVHGYPEQKVSKTLSISKNKPGMVVHLYNPSYSGARGRIAVQVWPQANALSEK